MHETSLKTNVLSSLLWKFLERCGVTGAYIIIQIVLARLLVPEDYGVIALIAVFITISQCFVQSGLNTALIQKKEVTETDYSSVFYVSLLIAMIFYGILFVTSPFIAAFYNQPLITPVLKVLGLTLFFSALNSIQNAFIARNFQFKKLFVSSVGAIIISGIIGITLAYNGLGVWALVGQQLSSVIITCIIMWFTVKWKPKILFSLKRVKSLFSFGWKLLVTALMDITFNNLSTLIIGKIYPANMLGYYNQGNQYPNLLVSNIDSTIQAVMLPAYAKSQDNKIAVKQIMRRSLVTSSFIIFPSMIGLAVIAEPLIQLLLTDKWLMCVPFLQIFCLVYALWPIHTVNLQALNGIGRSDLFLKLGIIKIVIVGNAILIITIPLGIYAIAIGMIICSLLSTFINAYPNKKLLNYSFIEQWKDIAPSLILSMIMAGMVYCVILLGLPSLLTLFVQIPLGMIIYFGLAKLFHLESLEYILNTLKEYLPTKKC